ncbi:hypothetical protein BABINDRAFT_149583 [Babjeviella inositovora NRRL Y-12698]|uniref:Dolichyl-diphosphooligosaccharide--protein glycosyltransferase subunit 1 n=1 Tax=Babjeviella inositovora NRRL Y-12698 TaxID=984486 RepID=A0A1E3QQG3_9ASCO|nr:uncharacterized protein BABINDRAFT_149583 [Babjeviella inositovora NRRL Y-12698]ODQ79197.1 hypothetical protein BABINDRAFT_149583 [Babjeviella inositovora NRRL Y-12698]
MKYLAYLIVTFFAFLSVAATTDFVPPQVWKNTKYDRTVQLIKSYVKEQVTVTIANTGSQPNQFYFFALPQDVIADLSIISVELAVGKELVPATIHPETNGNVGFVRVQLPVPISPKSSIKISVTYIYTNHLTPALPKIYFEDEHMVVFRSYKLPLAAYETTNYNFDVMGVQLAKTQEIASAEYDAQNLEADFRRDRIVYTGDGSVAPLTFMPVTLTFERNFPLPRVYNLNRDVWVSHSGESVSFEEYYELGNDASALNRGFSRIEWMQARMAQRHSFAITGLELATSPNARELYYTDLVGNVSTSAVPEDGNMYIKPRFPLFGGWHYNFTVGWSTDLAQYLRVAGKDTYVMKVPVLAGLRDCTYDNVRLSFYLPEGAVLTDVASAVPYSEKIVDLLELSYLDTKGHTKVTLVYENVVDELRSADVLLTYEYDFNARLRKPFTVAAYIFTALFSYFVLTKINLAIRPEKASSKAT